MNKSIKYMVRVECKEGPVWTLEFKTEKEREDYVLMACKLRDLAGLFLYKEEIDNEDR